MIRDEDNFKNENEILNKIENFNWRVDIDEYIKSKMNLEQIQNLIKDHVNNKSDNSRKIYLLLMLAIWYDTFITNKKLN